MSCERPGNPEVSMPRSLVELIPRIQTYAWGSHRVIAEIQGRPPSEGPEAELWLGAHPRGPSGVVGEDLDLAELIARDLTHWLGAAAQRFDGRLPFLFKVLAADSALSIQAHPNLEQARAGFAREEAAGIPRDAFHRNYRDANHKPEIICALEPFEALCGFRPIGEILAVFAEIGAVGLDSELDALRARPDAAGLGRFFSGLLRREGRVELVERVSGRCAAMPAEALSGGAELVVRLHRRYPGDIGVVGALLLNHLWLQPGEALYLGAGGLHAYLQGAGVELMANSDNVLRGGLTPKHVDCDELLATLSFESGPAEVLRAQVLDRACSRWVTAVADFELTRIELTGGSWEGVPRGPELWLGLGGELELSVGGERLRLARGGAACVAGSGPRVRVRGAGWAMRATVGAIREG